MKRGGGGSIVSRMECEQKKAARRPGRSGRPVGQRSEESKLEATEQSTRRGAQLNAPDAPNAPNNSAIISRGNKPHFRHYARRLHSAPAVISLSAYVAIKLDRTRTVQRGNCPPSNPPLLLQHQVGIAIAKGEAPPEPFNAEGEVKRN